ncbi:multidrug ABC transporter [Acetobacter nitrogenifigens DSM 23921 = NBRC 105050]|uniref:Bcr/CflA family efflux transporter n=2 Tax=Acetobacter nitrogenifigens TaxID=285268 RepID=A0A511X8R5_9PROT|nr:multidrug ABC transporter [Acetobacter nitrogenifigens DSM 23921 = NBRC 105050]GEN59332.1 Bcr/CflA family drug resistance efflux transporter [Acetobacter nitrogenifigens DSM 23921 = NBRC 105050]
MTHIPFRPLRFVMFSAKSAQHLLAGAPPPLPLIVLLGAITAIGPLSTDMYLPAFPTLDKELEGGGPGSAQFTLATWFAGLAVGQFSCGPLSDRFGRRAPLIAGLLVFTLASIGCATTSDFHAFCLFRFLAALGGAVGAVVPRAFVRDIATGRDGARIMTQLTLVFGAMPILAPSLGGAVLTFGSWRWIFWIAVLYGVAGILAVYLMLPDTLPLSRRVPLHPAAILNRYINLLGEPNFVLNAIIASAGTFVTFAYLGGAPVVFEHLIGFTPMQFALFFGVNAATFILCNQISGKLVQRVPVETLMQRGVAACASAAALFLLLTVLHVATPGHPALVAVLIMMTTGTLGFVGANATVLAFHHHGAQAGSASALLGTMQFSIGAISGVLMGYMPTSSIIPMAFVMGIGALMMVVADVLRKRLCAPVTA